MFNRTCITHLLWHLAYYCLRVASTSFIQHPWEIDVTHCCSFKHYYFIYLSWRFCLKFCLHTFLIKVVRLPFELFENFNSLFTNKNYFIICNLVRPLWTVAFYSHFCSCIKWDYFVLLNSLFAFPCVFLLDLPSTVLTFLSFQFFWLPLMKWLTIYGFSEGCLIRLPPLPKKFFSSVFHNIPCFWDLSHFCVSDISAFLLYFKKYSSVCLWNGNNQFLNIALFCSGYFYKHLTHLFFRLIPWYRYYFWKAKDEDTEAQKN